MGFNDEKSEHIVENVYGGIGKIGTVHSPQEAGEKFVEVLSRNIEVSGVSAGVMGAVDKWEVGEIQTSDGIHFEVHINYNGNPHRESLFPDPDRGYPDGLDNIVLLYDQGVDHVMNRVYGEWHGKRVESRIVIPKAHYIESAIQDFMVSYADQYGVVDVEYNGTYSE